MRARLLRDGSVSVGGVTFHTFAQAESTLRDALEVWQRAERPEMVTRTLDRLAELGELREVTDRALHGLLEEVLDGAL